MDYIHGIDETLYTRHAFPLPQLGKICSNPVEQANSGLLPIRFFAPFKLLIELWYYIEVKFNERRAKALQANNVYTEPAQFWHEQNLRSFGRWGVLDDGGSQAKVHTMDHHHEYLVRLDPKPACNCFELQDMILPCEHIMAWDDHEGRDYGVHFHPCWRYESMRRLYEPKFSCFLTSDLQSSANFFPPKAIVKKGQQRIVRMQSGMRFTHTREPTKDEYLDSDGNLFRVYAIEDEAHLVTPMTPPAIVGRAPNSNTSIEGNGRGKRRTCPNSRRRKCSTCGIMGHNVRTCP